MFSAYVLGLIPRIYSVYAKYAFLQLRREPISKVGIRTASK